MADNPIVVEDRGPIRVVRLNRPAALNAVNGHLRRAFIAAMDAAQHDGRVEAVVVTGTGERAFCAGQDIDEAAGLATPRAIAGWLTDMRDLYQSVRDVDKPTVVAFNGLAAGAGMQIGLAADVRIGYPGMRFGQPEVRAGLASVVGTWFLSQYVGAGINAELSLSGELISGERAHALGLLTRLVPQPDVLPVAIDEAERLARMPRTAYRLTKRRLRELTQPGFDAAYRAGVAAQQEAYAAGDPQRAMAAFLARRRRPD